MTATTAEVDQAPISSPAPVHHAAPTADSSVDRDRIKYGVWLSAAAFLLLGVVSGIGVTRMTVGSDMVAALGSVTTVVGTIIGAYFGVQIGSHGKEAAEAERTHAEAAARLALGKLDPKDADDVNQKLCEARAGSPRRPGHR